MQLDAITLIKFSMHILMFNNIESEELKSHIIELAKIITDDETSTDDVNMTFTTLRDILNDINK